MNGIDKLTAHHKELQAVVYLRQSSEAQVKQNIESKALQYSLKQTAQQLGFSNIEVIDEDLGKSAAAGAERRAGFERLLTMIALGQVGVLLSREVSRLSRTDKEWCQLLELCQAFNVIIGDAEGLYDLQRLDDQLVLGIKGTMSVVELKVLHNRLNQGKIHKAQRGAYYPKLPVGYIQDGQEGVVKDPNLRIQERISLIFKKFDELPSIRQTFKWFVDERITLPVTTTRGGKNVIEFHNPNYSFISGILHNPFYAGVYVYGRRPVVTKWEDGILRKRQTPAVALDEIKIFIKEHHEGYITWQKFESNQKKMSQNTFRYNADDSIGAIRCGQGLLAGLLRCGRCGRKLHVHYWGKAGTAARYLCKGDFNGGGKYCLGFGGQTVDRHIGQEVCKALRPLAVEASLAALKLAKTNNGEKYAVLKQEVDKLDYDAQRAFEQYNAVDCRNRLVALELENRWNDCLNALESARENLNSLNQNKHTLSDKEKAEILWLGENFETVWQNPDCSSSTRKAILRTVIKEIICDETEDGMLLFIIHWQGGVHTQIKVKRPLSGAQRSTDKEDLEIIRKMTVRYGDNDIARVLNKLGRTTGNGNPWNQSRVKSARLQHKIRGRAKTIISDDIFTLNGAARHCNVSDTTISRLAKAGILPMNQIVPWAPWEIKREDLESDPVKSIIEQLKTSGKLNLTGVFLDNQQSLFQ